MKIGFVFQKDSHLKAVEMTALRLIKQYSNAQICFFGLLADCNLKPNISVSYQVVEYDNFSVMGDCDYLICCLGGYSLNQLIKYYQYSLVKIISLFPGVVSHYQLDVFITRFNADQVWFNCPADLDFYAKLCYIFKIKNNGILYGAPWINSDLPRNSATDNSIIFFEQTQVVTSIVVADRIVTQLVDFIKSRPNRKFVYKTRNNIYNEYLLDIREKIQSLPNIIIVDELDESEIIKASEYLSISSSAIIEGLAYGKQCYLLGDSYLDDDSYEIFINSGLFLNKSQQVLNQKWLNDRVCMPNQYVDLFGIHKHKLLDISQKSIGSIICCFIHLFLAYPKLFKIVSRKKLKIIKKSLEYLSDI